MKIRINGCVIYICLFLLYNLQGVLYASGGIVSGALLLLCLLISAFNCVKVWRQHNMPSFFYGLFGLLALFTVYGLLDIAFGQPAYIRENGGGEAVSKIEYLKTIYLSLLPIPSFYYYAIKGKLTVSSLRRWTFLFIVVATLSFIRMEKEAIESSSFIDSYGEITNNAGYILLSVIPLSLLFTRKSIVQYAIMLYCMLIIIVGMKRGAILIGVILILYVLYHNYKTSVSGKRKFAVVCLGLLSTAVIASLIIYLYNNNAYFIRRLEDTIGGNTSNRDDIYSYFWNYFLHKADILTKLVGNGANGTLRVYINYAHNDWLEVLTNQGLLGIIIFAFYWVSACKTWRHSSNKEAKFILSVIFLLYFLKSFFSMSYGGMSIYSTSLLGLALSKMNESSFSLSEVSSGNQMSDMDS